MKIRLRLIMITIMMDPMIWTMMKIMTATEKEITGRCIKGEEGVE